MIATAAGGGHQYPWLAQSWKWSNGGKTLTLDDPPGRQVVGRQAADRGRRRLQPHGRQAEQGRSTSSASYRDGTNIASVQQKGQYGVAITLKTPDSQFIAAHAEPADGRPAAHLLEGAATCRRGRTRTRSAPARSRRSRGSRRRTTSSARTRTTGCAGAPKVPCLEYMQATSNDAALLLIQSGQVDWTHNFVPNVETAYSPRIRRTTTRSMRRRRIRSRSCSTRRSTRTASSPFRQAISMAINRSAGLEAR